MARNFVTGGSDRISFAGGLPDMNNSQPISLSFWFQADVDNLSQYLFNLNNATNDGQGLTVYLSNPGRINFTQKGATSTFVSSNDNAFPVDSSWHHFCVTTDGGLTASNITMYVDGSALSNRINQNGTTRIASTGDWIIGGRWVGDNDRTFDGGLSDFGFWDNVKLSVAEVTALSQGVSPKLIKPDDLVFAPDLRRETVDPIFGGISTITGTTIVSGPSIIQPSSQILQFPERRLDVAGDATTGITEADMVTGGKEVTLTLHNNQWVSS